MRSGRVRRRSTVGLVLSDQTERPVLEVSGMGGGSTFVHVYRRSFLVKIGLNFNPCATFQTFRHLTLQFFYANSNTEKDTEYLVVTA